MPVDDVHNHNNLGSPVAFSPADPAIHTLESVT